MKQTVNPIVTVIRPVLTEEEREKRKQEVIKAAAAFMAAIIRIDKEKEKSNV